MAAINDRKIRIKSNFKRGAFYARYFTGSNLKLT
jgi:hypothetical protein